MKTRIKMHQMPGDIGKGHKIAMMEGTTHRLGNPVTGKKWDISKADAKKWKKWLILPRERAILKERTRKEIDAQVS